MVYLYRIGWMSKFDFFFLGKVHTFFKKMCYSTLTSLGEVRVALVTLVAHADVAGGVVEAVPLVLAGAGGGPAGAVASRAAKIPRARGVPGAIHVVVQCVGPYLPVHEQLFVEEVPARAGGGLVEHRLVLRLRLQG